MNLLQAVINKVIENSSTIDMEDFEENETDWETEDDFEEACYCHSNGYTNCEDYMECEECPEWRPYDEYDDYYDDYADAEDEEE